MHVAEHERRTGTLAVRAAARGTPRPGPGAAMRLLAAPEPPAAAPAGRRRIRGTSRSLLQAAWRAPC
jgi:hypothetical protein